MKVKTSKLQGAALDWAVAKCEGLDPKHDQDAFGRTWRGWWVSNPEFEPMAEYSTNWAQGGPIVEAIGGLELKQWLESSKESRCEAHIHNYDGNWIEFGPTPLVAAMRCYVASKLGEEVDVPDELVEEKQ